MAWRPAASTSTGGYRGHIHPYKFRVWISGQIRCVTAAVRCETRRRAAVEPVIGHMKVEHRMDRNYPKGRNYEHIGAVLAAAGYNFGLLLRSLAKFLRDLILVAAHPLSTTPDRLNHSKCRSSRTIS